MLHAGVKNVSKNCLRDWRGCDRALYCITLGSEPLRLVLSGKRPRLHGGKKRGDYLRCTSRNVPDSCSLALFVGNKPAGIRLLIHVSILQEVSLVTYSLTVSNPLTLFVSLIVVWRLRALILHGGARRRLSLPSGAVKLLLPQWLPSLMGSSCHRFLSINSLLSLLWCRRFLTKFSHSFSQ